MPRTAEWDFVYALVSVYYRRYYPLSAAIISLLYSFSPDNNSPIKLACGIRSLFKHVSIDIDSAIVSFTCHTCYGFPELFYANFPSVDICC